MSDDGAYIIDCLVDRVRKRVHTLECTMIELIEQPFCINDKRVGRVL